MGIREGLLKTGETRVWRTYCGGAALERWHGREGGNGHFPEDWAASTTRAINYGREEIVEGLSRVISLEGEPTLLMSRRATPRAITARRMWRPSARRRAFWSSSSTRRSA